MPYHQTGMVGPRQAMGDLGVQLLRDPQREKLTHTKKLKIYYSSPIIMSQLRTRSLDLRT